MDFKIGDEVVIPAGTKQYMIEQYNAGLLSSHRPIPTLDWVPSMNGMEGQTLTIAEFCGGENNSRSRYDVSEVHAGFRWHCDIFFIPVSCLESEKTIPITPKIHRI